MPPRGIRIGVVVALLAAGGLWLLFGRTPRRPVQEELPPRVTKSVAPPGKPSPEKKEAAKELPRAFYVELKEVNKDDFQETLFISDVPETLSPFLFFQGRLLVTPEALQAIADGTEKEKFRLFIDKPKMDVAKEAKLFLTHQVRYEGVGREGSFANHYIFSQYPAQVILPVYEKPEDMRLGVNDSVAKTFQVRLIPDQALILSEKEKGQVEVTFAGKKSVLLAEGQEILSRLQHATAITQELFAPVPKGKVSSEDFKIMTEEFGKIDFSTELSVKNIGQLEIVVGKESPPTPPAAQ